MLKVVVSETLIWMPIYNEERYLRATLDSVLAQSDKDWKLVISDNHSTDGSAYIIETYAQNDTRITYRKTPRHMAGIEHMRDVWDRLDRGQKYTISIGGHDLWPAHHLASLVNKARFNPDFAIVYPDTWVMDEHGQLVGHYKDATEWGQLPAIMRPQVVIASVNSPQLFGLWNEAVRLKTPFRHCCSGWDHCIVMEASLHGSILYEGGTSLHLRAPKPGADLEDYGKRHLTADALAQGPADFLHQLDWCIHALDIALEEVPDEARPMYRAFLTASMVGTYITLRGVNLHIVPGATDAFNQIPEVRAVFSGLAHADKSIRQLLGYQSETEVKHG